MGQGTECCNVLVTESCFEYSWVNDQLDTEILFWIFIRVNDQLDTESCFEYSYVNDQLDTERCFEYSYV